MATDYQIDQVIEAVALFIGARKESLTAIDLIDEIQRRFAATTSDPDRRVIARIEQQLAWRGPGGRGQGHIVLTRVEAVTALRAFGVEVSDEMANR